MIIEPCLETGGEWAVSFNGSEPQEHEFVVVTSKEDAEKLLRLAKGALDHGYTRGLIDGRG